VSCDRIAYRTFYRENVSGRRDFHYDKSAPTESFYSILGYVMSALPRHGIRFWAVCGIPDPTLTTAEDDTLRVVNDALYKFKLTFDI